MNEHFNNHDQAFAEFARRMNRDSRKAMIDYPPFVFWDTGIDQAEIQADIKARPDSIFNKLLGLYIHIPFCSERCSFCRYPFYIDIKRIDDFLEALYKEMDLYAGLLDNAPLRSVMIGGGTPSILDERQLKEFLENLRQKLNLKNTLQVSFEAHPASLNEKKIKVLADLGVNRISLGIQSMDPDVLRTVNRTQKKDHIKNMHDAIRAAGIDNIQIDLITGLPGQSVESFVADLTEVLSWKPASITVYEFIPASLTSFYRMGNRFSDADLKRIEEMAAQAAELFSLAGYLHKPGNSTAMLKPGVYTLGVTDAFKFNSSFIGLGPFSHSHLTGSWRYANSGNLNEYIRSVKEGRLPVERGIRLDVTKELVSYLFNQLWKGAVSKRAVEMLYGSPLDSFAPIIERLRYLESRGKLLIREHYIKSLMVSQEEWLTYCQYLFCDDIQKRIFDFIKETD